MDMRNIGFAESGRDQGFDHGNPPAPADQATTPPAKVEEPLKPPRPGAMPRKAAAIGYTLFDTAFGVCGIAWSERGVLRIALPERTPEETETRLRRQAGTTERVRPPRTIAAVIRAMQHYFEGGGANFSHVRIDLSAEPEFERRVYKALREVGWGLTLSYGELAILAGAPGAARAVGRAMAKNPLPVLVPCHRVIASGGAIGGFSAHGGLATKQKMLALEKVTLPLE